MNNNLLILGAGACGMSAKEIAEELGCFGKIAFLDDTITSLPTGDEVLGCINDFEKFATDFGYIFVAIGNPQFKLSLLKQIQENTPYAIATLISPSAYVSNLAQVMQGTIIEPMAVINTGSVISTGCIIGAGSVVNHSCMCCDGVHLECNATVADHTVVPAGTFVKSGVVYDKNDFEIDDLFINSAAHQNKTQPHPPTPIEGLEYSFESGM